MLLQMMPSSVSAGNMENLDGNCQKKKVEDFERTWYHGRNATAFVLVAPSVPSRTDGMYSFG